MPAIESPVNPGMEKVWREVSRPFRQIANRLPGAPARAAASNLAQFSPDQCTVEPEGLALLSELVVESQQFPGPIIEIGTLLGITATHMALSKAPAQKITTVDVFCWNPWGLNPDAHEALARQVLHYLIARGEVESIRMDKNEYYRTYDGPAPAMVFLDAIHDYEETKKDIEWAQRVGAKIIAGHDYSDAFPGVMQIVDEQGGPQRLGGTVWVL